MEPLVPGALQKGIQVDRQRRMPKIVVEMSESQRRRLFEWPLGGFLAASLCLLALGLCRAALGQQQSIIWEPDYDKAFKDAKADGRPVMIAFIMDGEPANDEVARTHFKDKDVVSASLGFHCLVASVGVHAATSGEGVCQRFGCNTCVTHQRIQMRAQENFIRSTQVSAPQFIYVAPDGTTVLLRHVWLLPPSALAAKMRLALSFIDEAKATDAEKQTRDQVTRALSQANHPDASIRSGALTTLAGLDDPRIISFLLKQTAEEVEEPRRVQAIDAMGAEGTRRCFRFS